MIKMSFRIYNLLWILLFIGSLNFIYRTSAELSLGSYIDIGIVHRLITTILVGIIISLFFFKKIKIIFKNKLLILLIIYSLLRILSFLWSPLPLWTLYRGLEYLIVIMLLSYTFTRIDSYKDLYTISKLFYIFFSILVLSSIIGIVIFGTNLAFMTPKGQSIPMLQGVIPRINPNGLSQFSAVVFFMSLLRYIYFKKFLFLYLAFISFFVMLMAQSRSTLIAFSIALFFLLRHFKKLNLVGSIIFLFFALFFSIVLIDSSFNEIYLIISRGQDIDTVMTMSNRTDWWSNIFNYITDTYQFYTGVGSFVGGRIFIPLVLGDVIGDTTRITVDNTYLELLVDSGIIVTILFIYILYKLFKQLKIKKKYDNYHTQFFILEGKILFIILFIRSFFTSSLILHNQFILFLIILYVISIQKINKRRFL